MKNKITKKVEEWIKRYWLAELFSYGLAIGGGTLTFYFTNNYYISGLIVMIGDNVGYYSVIFTKEILNTIKLNNGYNINLFFRDFRNLGFEFGIPEIIESIIIYPLLVFYVPELFSSYPLGIFIAMTIAVFIFYIQAIILYEIKKKYFN